MQRLWRGGWCGSETAGRYGKRRRKEEEAKKEEKEDGVAVVVVAVLCYDDAFRMVMMTLRMTMKICMVMNQGVLEPRSDADLYYYYSLDLLSYFFPSPLPYAYLAFLL